MERIPDVEEAIGSALLSLGDGNWRMGDGMPVAKSNLGSGDEPIVIEHFMCKLLISILIHIDNNCRYRRRSEHSNHKSNNHLQIPKTPRLRLDLPPQQHLQPPHHQIRLLQRELYAAAPNARRRSRSQVFVFWREGGYEGEVHQVF